MEKETAFNILGIDENASPGQIKKAYKRLCMKHHPDRGGDPEIMQSLNDAYDLLVGDSAGKEINILIGEAYSILTKVFESIIQSNTIDFGVDPVKTASDTFTQSIANAKTAITNFTSEKLRYTRYKGKMKTRNGKPNVFEFIINKKIAEIDGAMKNAEHSIEIFKLCGEMLVDYEYLFHDGFLNSPARRITPAREY